MRTIRFFRRPIKTKEVSELHIQLGSGFIQLANAAIGSLLFGQALLDEGINLNLTTLGIVLFITLYGIAILFLRRKP